MTIVLPFIPPSLNRVAGRGPYNYRKAKEECTRQGILLPCWKCGGEAEVNELHTGGKPIYAAACKKHHCGAYGAGSVSIPKAIEFWNTRPAPPVGRCGECALKDTFDCICSKNGHTDKIMEYCSFFEPKEAADDRARQSGYSPVIP